MPECFNKKVNQRKFITKCLKQNKDSMSHFAQGEGHPSYDSELGWADVTVEIGSINALISYA